MENIIKNKRIIFICIGLLLVTFIIYLFTIKDKDILNETTEDYTYLKNYSSNEYVPVYVTEEDRAK